MIPTLQTFNEWSAAGYLILKGSKSVGRNEKGVPLFHISQVKRKEPPLYCGWDGATDENCCGGPVYGIYGNCD